MILDTNFVIDLMNREESAVNKLKELISNGEPQIITTPTLFELYSGMMRSHKPETEKRKILHVLSNLITWHLDPVGAEKAGEVDGRLILEGNTIDPIDSMIAGIALSNGEIVLTRNVKHFSRIPGLKVETY